MRVLDDELDQRLKSKKKGDRGILGRLEKLTRLKILISRDYMGGSSLLLAL